MEVALRPRTRALLILEFLIGAAPAIALYVYFCPVGLFWVRRVLELATDGTSNAFTTSFALLFVAGGVGLLSLCILFLARLSGRGFPGRALLAGLLAGVVAALGLLFLSWRTGGYWTDYIFLGLPILVTAHLLYCGMRHDARRSEASGHPSS
jgi:glucan phosphoethanolaminetransferase (alkaline phosphatase superfamily)